MNSTRPRSSLAWLLPFLAAACNSGAPAPSPTPAPATTLAAAPRPTPTSPQGEDFAADARLLYRVVACIGDEPVPKELNAAVLKQHCDWMSARIKNYQEKYAAQATPFFAALLPKDAPTTLVYPFGGGDLLSALTTYPQAQEITTLSLELAGDPRRIHGLDKAKLAESLSVIRHTIAGLIEYNDSTSENLAKGQRGEIPGQLAFFLVGLAAHDLEPVSLRYFRVEKDGTLHYLTHEEIAAVEKKLGRARHGKWNPPDFSEAFANSELGFRAKGAPATAPVMYHRHIAANINDPSLARDSSVLRHIEAKGRVSTMTKAASYCLWRPDFSKIRDYLLDRSVVMVSDSTGIPPSFFDKAGFTVETYGKFSTSFLNASKTYNDDFRKLWKSQPARELPIRFGYLDGAGHNHMFVIKKAATEARKK